MEGDVADLTTLPRLLQRNARDFADRPAIREKDRGIWQSWTWREYHDQVRDLALGLASLGLKRGDRLSVIGDNRPRLYAAQLAVQCLGGVSVAVYQDSIAKELAFVWNHAEVGVIVTEDQEQVDKVVGLRAELPALRVVIYDDPRGMLGYKHEWLKSYEDVQEAGRRFGAEHPGYFQAEIDKGKADDIAVVCYTSGTTGNPKGAMITHANAIGVAEIFCRQEGVVPEDTSLAYLPMAWAGDAVYTLFASLVAGFCSNCPESPETVQRDLRELGPTTVLAPPRIWENMLTGIQVKAADAPALKRWVFETFRAVAERGGQPDDRRPALPGHRGQDRRAGRGAGPRSRHLQGLPQERRGHARGDRSRRLVPHGRRGVRGSPRPSRHHRPRQGRRSPPGRHPVRAAVHREQAEVQ